MEKYRFGITAEQVPAQTATDFEVLNINPYSSAYFDDPQHMSVCRDIGRITSIPSPYARMHITDLAFKEANCGQATMSRGRMQRRALSADYNRAMSHCLDIYELLFNADQINLQEKGITLHKLDLVSTHSVDPNVLALFQDQLGEPTRLKSYIETLDLFRDEYVNTLRGIAQRNGVTNYSFDFTSLYILKYKGKTFASTSPFTGFYAKADCDLSELSLEVDNRTHHKLLTGNPDDWTGLETRSTAFKDFMYLLLRDTGLQYIFESLFGAVKLSVDDHIQALNQKRITKEPQYQKFNINRNPLQKIDKKQLFIRPDGLDCSYIKYLLYLEEPVDLTISEDDYSKLPIEHRRFPADSKENCPWIGVNDILSDGLFILTYDVNEHYITVPYKDLTDGNQGKNRCLIPIKSLALKYFTLDELVQGISIVKFQNGRYSVSLTMPLQGGGETVLRREYYAGANLTFPNGVVIEGEQMRPFAFGIYPFIKVRNAANIYKILFYNSFESDYSLKFYKTDRQGQIVDCLPTEHESNKTNDIANEELPVNCEYHQLSVSDDLAYAQVVLKLDSGKEVSSFIVPRLKTPNVIPGRVNVAIDLGTSNTYMAYTYTAPGVNFEIRPINTHHVGNKIPAWNELTFMNKRCSKQEDAHAPEQNREDLYLRVSDRDEKPSDEWLTTQLNEFIPSRIDDGGYQFPIPTVINFLRQNCTRANVVNNAQLNPLINTAIPFAYYERGIRKGAQPYYYDRISDGSAFKWFCERNQEGNIQLKDGGFYKECFKAFVYELLFIVRSHLLSCGYNLHECSLLWSYPLSFDDFLVGEYKQIWGEAYKKFIYDCGNKDPYQNDPNFGGYRVAYTNESRSPIFHCMDNITTSHRLTLLMDVGGGSTDVIGYQADSHGIVKPKFITSFGFAGNALYLGSSMNQIDSNNMQNTLFARKIQRQPLFEGTQQNPGEFGVYRIGFDRSISELMNYGFAKDPINFQNIFRDNDTSLVLKLHNSAIIYHVAQLCCIYSPQELPVQIYLTGNGSKLFLLNPDRDQNIRGIFKYVYRKFGGEKGLSALTKIDGMRITNPPAPKTATVNGALKGLSRGIELNDASKTGRIVMAGDSSTALELLPADGGADVGVDYDVVGKVLPNVQEFIEMFYSIVYTTKTPRISKDQMVSYLEEINGNYALNVPQSGLLSDSLFFQYIALLMEQVSR